MSLITVHVSPPTGTITLNRPDKRNALSRSLLAELDQAFDDLHQEKRVRAVVLTGAGSAFSGGMDLAEMLATSKEVDALAIWQSDSQIYRDLLERMLLFPKPIVAAVNGPAMAGGLGLVVASDIIIASDTAHFGLPEPRRGLVAGIVSPLLAFRVGGGQAAHLLLTGKQIGAVEAHRIGLVHEMAMADGVLERAGEVALECARSAPEALQLTKRMLNEVIGENLATLLTAGAAASATARTTEAAAEGLAAFFEKREPRWQ